MNCVRECARPCRCEECAETQVHDDQPTPADQGLLCKRCASQLRGWLSTVLDDTLRLNTRIPDDYTYDHGHTHSKISGSPALVRLDVAALTDPRTRPLDHNLQGTEFWDRNPPMDIPGTVCSWALMLAEECGLSSPVATMAESVGVLTAWFDTILTMPWVDDFYSEMQSIRVALNSAHNRRPPLPRGDCFTCGASLWQEDGDGQDDITCRKCHRVYDAVGRVKLQLQRDRDRNTAAPVDSGA